MNFNEAGSRDADRRGKPRKASNLRAWADPGGVLPVIDCRIIDITADGAQVAAPQGVELPDAFMLRLDSARVVGEAHVVWRKGEFVGVKFVKPD